MAATIAAIPATLPSAKGNREAKGKILRSPLEPAECTRDLKEWNYPGRGFDLRNWNSARAL